MKKIAPLLIMRHLSKLSWFSQSCSIWHIIANQLLSMPGQSAVYMHESASHSTEFFLYFSPTVPELKNDIPLNNLNSVKRPLLHVWYCFGVRCIMKIMSLILDDPVLCHWHTHCEIIFFDVIHPRGWSSPKFWRSLHWTTMMKLVFIMLSMLKLYSVASKNPIFTKFNSIPQQLTSSWPFELNNAACPANIKGKQ